MPKTHHRGPSYEPTADASPPGNAPSPEVEAVPVKRARKPAAKTAKKVTTARKAAKPRKR